MTSPVFSTRSTGPVPAVDKDAALLANVMLFGLTEKHAALSSVARKVLLAGGHCYCGEKVSRGTDTRAATTCIVTPDEATRRKLLDRKSVRSGGIPVFTAATFAPSRNTYAKTAKQVESIRSIVFSTAIAACDSDPFCLLLEMAMTTLIIRGIVLGGFGVVKATSDVQLVEYYADGEGRIKFRHCKKPLDFTTSQSDIRIRSPGVHIEVKTEPDDIKSRKLDTEKCWKDIRMCHDNPLGLFLFVGPEETGEEIKRLAHGLDCETHKSMNFSGRVVLLFAQKISE